MNTKRNIVNIMIFIFITSFSCNGDESSAIEIVKNHLNRRLSVGIDDYFSVVEYYHPDIAIPPGDQTNVHIVSKNFKISNVEITNMNVNMMEPVEEEIIIVTVDFQVFGDIRQYKFTQDESVFSRKYYLSKSTGELLIIDYSDAFWRITTYEEVIKWAQMLESKNIINEDLTNSLLKHNP